MGSKQSPSLPTTIQDEKRSSLAIFALYLVAVAVFSDMYITQPILPLLAQEFHVSAATTGLSVSAVVVMIALASSAYGPLGDALGRKRVMVMSCLLLTLPTLGCALTSSFQLLLFFRALQGLLIPGVTAVAVAYIGDQFQSADLGSVVGGFISATVAGGLIGRVVSGLITEFFFWRAAFVLFALITLLGGIALAWLLPADKPSTSAGWIVAYRGMFAHLRNRRLVGAFLIGCTLFFGFIGVFTYLPYYLSGTPFRLSTGAVSSIYVVYLAGVIISPLAGRLSRRLSRQRIMAIGLSVALLGMLGTLVHSLPIIILSLIVLCLGMFTAQATAPAFVNATAATSKGGANALYLGFYYLGASFGSVLPGLAWQSWGWSGVIVICISALLLALLADWRLCQ